MPCMTRVNYVGKLVDDGFPFDWHLTCTFLQIELGAHYRPTDHCNARHTNIVSEKFKQFAGINKLNDEMAS